jgi:hypothetical protein
MSEIKREYAYRTTDGKLHSGTNAAICAKTYQKRLDFRKTIKSMIPAVEEIFGLEDLRDGDDGDTDETVLIEKVNETLLCDFNDLEDLIHGFVDLQIDIPEFEKFLILIKERFKKFK